jgi:hypothetical protein
VKKLYARLEILLRNWLAGSKTVVSISRDATVRHNVHAVRDMITANNYLQGANSPLGRVRYFSNQRGFSVESR